ncbi:unnamed protein product [Meloidogyne enterolobii]|uniref:Uncharacterized protein n=1 Tax=Meloidogyne enterolobii TaxID=390850 RepID=A0ACB0YLD9_MELEN
MSEGSSNSDWILVGKKKNNLFKKANDLFNKNTGNLINLNNCVDFVEVKNKWSKIEINGEPSKCCDNECINTNKPYGNCIKGNGYGNIINDEDIEYFNCLEGRKCFDKYFGVYTKNSFKKPQRCFKYSLHYFEVKCKFERKLNNDKIYMNIGLQNLNTNKFVEYSAKRAVIINEGSDFKNNDIFV